MPVCAILAVKVSYGMWYILFVCPGTVGAGLEGNKKERFSIIQLVKWVVGIKCREVGWT